MRSRRCCALVSQESSEGEAGGMEAMMRAKLSREGGEGGGGIWVEGMKNRGGEEKLES